MRRLFYLNGHPTSYGFFFDFLGCIFFPKISLLIIIVCAYDAHVGEGHSTCVETRGQLCGVCSFLLPLRGFEDQTQLIRIMQQVPLGHLAGSAFFVKIILFTYSNSK